MRPPLYSPVKLAASRALAPPGDDILKLTPYWIQAQQAQDAGAYEREEGALCHMKGFVGLEETIASEAVPLGEVDFLGPKECFRHDAA